MQIGKFAELFYQGTNKKNMIKVFKAKRTGCITCSFAFVYLLHGYIVLHSVFSDREKCNCTKSLVHPSVHIIP